MSPKKDISKIAFYSSLTLLIFCLAFAYGYIVAKWKIFPATQIQHLYTAINEAINPSDEILNDIIDDTQTQAVIEQSEIAQAQLGTEGLLLLVRAQQTTRNSTVSIINKRGQPLHQLNVNLDDVWTQKELSKFPPNLFMPKASKGMYIHGLDVLDDGSFVANFEHVSTFRMDLCGNVLWKLDNLGHHSVHVTPEQEIWVTAEKYIEENPTGYENHYAPLRSWTLQKINLNGEITREISIIDLLIKNGFRGLLHMSAVDNFNTAVSFDTLHLNDVDVFPVGYESAIFESGDIMISLRNVNAIFVFDPETLKIKYHSIGQFLRHHDPDFQADGTITLFDNNNLESADDADQQSAELRSRILQIDVESNKITTLIGKQDHFPFFTSIMGTHQLLDNGNVLVNSSGQGVVSIYSPEGKVLANYKNNFGNAKVGRIYNAIHLPESWTEAFVSETLKQCQRANS